MSRFIWRFSAAFLLSTVLTAKAEEAKLPTPGEAAMSFLEMYAKPETQTAAGPALGMWIVKRVDAGDFEGALATLRPIQEKRPEDVQVMMLTGMVHGRMGRFDKAEPLLEKAVAAGADDRAFDLLVVVKMQLGKWEWCETNKQRLYDRLVASPVMLLGFAQWAGVTRKPSILNDAMARLSPGQVASLKPELMAKIKKVQDDLAGIAADAAPKPDAEGFVSIFDGTLKNWDGDPVYWRAENGVLIGEVKPETLLKQNSFIVWRGGEVGDFELKGEYRVSAEGNSGINYRSIDVPGTKWAMQGYQDDIDGKDAWSGQNYEERGRTFLAYRGQSVVVHPDGKPQVVKELGDRAELQQKVRKEDWNEVHIIARGNLMQHFTNGVLMAEVLDEDPNGRRMSGLIGVQVHVGPPMKIEFRNLRVKTLSPSPVPPTESTK